VSHHLDARRLARRAAIRKFKPPALRFAHDASTTLRTAAPRSRVAQPDVRSKLAGRSTDLRNFRSSARGARELDHRGTIFVTAPASQGTGTDMRDRILITGGAGFIGSHLADEMLARGYRVRVLDNLSPQVHGESPSSRPEYLSDDVELIVGDVRDSAAVRRALAGVDTVYHFAAAVGVGQSMYQIAHYTGVNDLGTAVVLEAIVEQRDHVQRLIVASSMSIYGEGLYQDSDGHVSPPLERSLEQLRNHEWEVRNNRQQVLTPLPTPEAKPPALASVYAMGKYQQERMCLMVGRAYAIPTAALRFFNVYGTRQALSNPYTGVLAIFAARLLNGRPPAVFEDGKQQRDFVSVHDVAQCCRLALEVADASGRVFNVGSGQAYSVLDVAEKIAKAVGRPDIEPQVSGRYRVGDIRHCFADIRLAERLLGYQPKVSFADGLAELAGWLQGRVADDRADSARAELDARGLAI
jgi:dTDP-L-rhamnose 4-epimerase